MGKLWTFAWLTGQDTAAIISQWLASRQLYMYQTALQLSQAWQNVTHASSQQSPTADSSYLATRTLG